MRIIVAVATITFKEGLRHRILYGIIVSAFLLVIFSVLASGLFMRDILKVLIDICLSATSVSGLLVPFFLSINLLARDIESQTIYTILAKPISRSEYIIGRFLGLSLISAVLMMILTLATIISIWLSSAIIPAHFFQDLAFLPIFAAVFSSFLSILLLNSAVVLWCSVTTSSFLATLLTLTTYVIGQTVEDLVRFIDAEIAGVYISPIIKITLKATMYICPNLSAFDLKQQAAYGLAISHSHVFLLSLYSIAYAGILLILTILIMRKRDLP